MLREPAERGPIHAVARVSCNGIRRMNDSLELGAPRVPADVADGAAGTRRIAGTIRLKPSGDKAATPELPHERDEEAGMTGGIPSQPMQQAYRDVKRGLIDTDRGVEAGRTYQKLKR